MGMIMKRSMYRNYKRAFSESKMVCQESTWKSPRDDAKEYNRVTVVNWIMEYSALARYQ
jgi:hypothetical protein